MLRKLFSFRTNEGKLYYATSTAAAGSYFSNRKDVSVAVFCGEELVPVKLLERCGRGIYKRVERRYEGN